MTTKPLNRASYPIGHACELLNVNASQLEELLNAGVLNHAADGVQICAKSMEAYRSPSESEWLHGEKPLQIKDGGWYKRRDGEVVGPADRNRSQSYPWRLGGKAYTKGGVCSEHAVGLNLICEVPPPIDGYRPTGEFRVPVRGQDVWFVLVSDGEIDRWELRGIHPMDVPTSKDGGKRWIAEKIPDEAEELTEADVEADGWKDWPGGECPVPPDRRVEVKLRDGSVYQNAADAFKWQHSVHDRRKRRRDIVAYRVVPADQPAETVNEKTIRRLRQITEDLEAEVEKQPQPGEWWLLRNGHGRDFVARAVDLNAAGVMVWEESNGNLFPQHSDFARPIRHLPYCTGFDYVPPPEQTLEEKRLEEVGISFNPTSGVYMTASHIRCADSMTPDQLEAIAAHMREQEGGAE